jgi:hypothetical protein
MLPFLGAIPDLKVPECDGIPFITWLVIVLYESPTYSNDVA